MNARVRHILITAAIILVVILLVGATYQGVATALERRKYPHPGQLVDVGGHQLHIYCTGEKGTGATVVLEAPEGGMSVEWGWVQSALSEKGRVCSYDRAGLGWSEAGDGPYDPARVPAELHQLLQNAAVPGPYVVVGQSLGAVFARMFASRYPDDVLAVVLVDMPNGRAPDDVQLMALSPWLARAGLLRAAGILSDRADGLPPRDAGVFRSFLNRPDHLTRASRELARWNQAVALAVDTPLPRHVNVQTLALRPEGLNDRLDAGRVTAAIPTFVIWESDSEPERRATNHERRR